MAKCLLQRGANPNALAELPPHPRLGGSRGLSGKAKLDKKGSGKGGAPSGWVGSALSLAVAYPDSEAVARYLLASGAAQPCPAGASPTPLHVACAVGASPATVAALLAAPGGISALGLLFAAKETAPGVVEAQRSLGKEEEEEEEEEVKEEGSRSVKSGKSKKNSKSPSKEPPGQIKGATEQPGLSGTPLHAAAAVGWCEADANDGGVSRAVVVEQLLACGASGQARDVLGRTALHVAALCGHGAATRALLTHAFQAEPSAHDDPNRNSQGLAEAEGGGGGDDLALCVDRGGKTALHHAIDSGASGVVRLLVTSCAGLAGLVTHGRRGNADLGPGGSHLGEAADQAAAGAEGSSGTRAALSVWAALPGVAPPRNALEYAEHVQLAALTPCRLAPPDNPFGRQALRGPSDRLESPGGLAAGGKKSSQSFGESSKRSKKGSASVPTEEDSSKGGVQPKKSALKAPVSPQKGSKSRSGSKDLDRAQADYGAWRRGFRAEFSLLTSPLARDMDAGVRYLLRHASGLSEAHVPFPPKPPPARPPAPKPPRHDAEGALFEGEGAAGSQQAGGQLFSGLSAASVDSWEASDSLDAKSNGSIGGIVIAKGVAAHTAAAAKASSSALAATLATHAAAAQALAAEAAAHAAETRELSQVWSAALAYVAHASEAYARGSSELAERWARLGPTAALVLQALVRRVQGALKVKKLRERLRQRRLNRSMGSARGQPKGPPSRVSVSSRGSFSSAQAGGARSGQNSARGPASSQGSARGNSRERGHRGRGASPGQQRGGGRL
jgi:ankyrin repeat protein